MYYISSIGIKFKSLHTKPHFLIFKTKSYQQIRPVQILQEMSFFTQNRVT